MKVAKKVAMQVAKLEVAKLEILKFWNLLIFEFSHRMLGLLLLLLVLNCWSPASSPVLPPASVAKLRVVRKSKLRKSVIRCKVEVAKFMALLPLALFSLSEVSLTW